jgi:hypothetical protein
MVGFVRKGGQIGDKPLAADTVLRTGETGV